MIFLACSLLSLGFGMEACGACVYRGYPQRLLRRHPRLPSTLSQRVLTATSFQFTPFQAPPLGYLLRTPARIPPLPASTSFSPDLHKVTDGSEGLGIIEFFDNKNILITGGTGFIGKVLIEKILRVQPNVGHLFLLMRASDEYGADKRMIDEIVCCDLFSLLRRIHGSSYKTFMASKLRAVKGDVTLNELGMDSHTKGCLSHDVHVIINLAASTAIDERYDRAFAINVQGVENVLNFAKLCASTEVIMHISSAYVNRTKEGHFYELDLLTQGLMPQSFASKCARDMIKLELKLIQETKDEVESSSCPPDTERCIASRMRELGMTRAAKYGWLNTYEFTKALGESVLKEAKEIFPLVVIRPSVIESSIMEPFCGWIEGNRMLDPIISFYGRGHLTGFVGGTSTIVDLVPVDMMVNAMLATMVEQAFKPDLKIYHVASSFINPISLGELTEMFYEHYANNPFINRFGNTVVVNKFRFFQEIEPLLHDVIKSSGDSENADAKHNVKRSKAVEVMEYFLKLYKPYMFNESRSDCSNLQKIHAQLSYQEKELFNFDMESIKWDHYMKDVHIPGLRKHVFKESRF